MKLLRIFLWTGFISILNAQIINVPDDHELIQDAIDIAQTGDTVLIAPGVYNQPFILNKNITVASYFLTTGDTSYISNTTVLDSSLHFPLIHMNNGSLIGLTLGIYGYGTIQNSFCEINQEEGSAIKIEHNIIYAQRFIYCPIEATLELNNFTFTGNKIIYETSPIRNRVTGYFIYSLGKVSLNNVHIKNNEAVCLNAENNQSGDLRLINVDIENNIGKTLDAYTKVFYAENLTILRSGSIFIGANDSLTIKNSTIAYNTSGITLKGSTSIDYPNAVMAIEGTSIHHNHETGLQIYPGFKELNINEQNLNSIYSNKGIVNDIKTSEGYTFTEPVLLDTFTTAQNTFIYTYSFVMDNSYNMKGNTIPVIANHYISSQINADLYVSPAGNDANSGLSTDQPFKTISHALDVIYADSLNPKTIHLAPGTYSESVNNEKFPLRPFYCVSIVGDDPQKTILDGESVHRVFDLSNYAGYVRVIFFPPVIKYIAPDQKLLLKNLKISGGLGKGYVGNDIFDGGVNIDEGSNVRFEKCIFTGNVDYSIGINRYAAPRFVNCTSTDMIGLSSDNKFYLINCILSNLDMNTGTYNPVIVNSWIDVDPDTIFTDPGNGAFTLLENSAAIDAGTAYYEDSGVVFIDLNPTQYAGFAPDLGAVEYGFVNSIHLQEVLPQKYSLSQNYPNPFNPNTTIEYQLPNKGKVRLEIFNLLGKKIAEPVNETKTAGKYKTNLDLGNLASGMYFYKLTCGKYSKIRKMLLIR